MPMKKIFTLLATALLTFAANAQVAFTDANGKEYADGETMIINANVDPDYGDVTLPCPIIVNKGNAPVFVKMEYKIIELTNKTAIQDCFSGSCNKYFEGSHSTAEKQIAAGKSLDTQIEWVCWDGNDYVQGSGTIELTLFVDGSKDKTVTVKYVYGEEADLNEVESELTVVAAYSLTGQLVDPSTRGIVLQKMSNGTIRKVINK